MAHIYTKPYILASNGCKKPPSPVGKERRNRNLKQKTKTTIGTTRDNSLYVRRWKFED